MTKIHLYECKNWKKSSKDWTFNGSRGIFLCLRCMCLSLPAGPVFGPWREPAQSLDPPAPEVRKNHQNPTQTCPKIRITQQLLGDEQSSQYCAAVISTEVLLHWCNPPPPLSHPPPGCTSSPLALRQHIPATTSSDSPIRVPRRALQA